MIPDAARDAAALDMAATLAEGFEGFSATPYKCPAGVWTIGYGSTHVKGLPVTASTPKVDKATAHSLMTSDLCSALTWVEEGVSVPMKANEIAALVDFVYNVGVGAFNGSTLLQKLNRRDFAGAACEFAKWNHGGGVVLAGLTRRRAAEAALFNK